MVKEVLIALFDIAQLPQQLLNPFNLIKLVGTASQEIRGNVRCIVVFTFRGIDDFFVAVNCLLVLAELVQYLGTQLQDVIIL